MRQTPQEESADGRSEGGGCSRRWKARLKPTDVTVRSCPYRDNGYYILEQRFKERILERHLFYEQTKSPTASSVHSIIQFPTPTVLLLLLSSWLFLSTSTQLIVRWLLVIRQFCPMIRWYILPPSTLKFRPCYRIILVTTSELMTTSISATDLFPKSFLE